MKEIQKKLRKINNYWNKYYFKKDFFQKRINFTDDVKTNYYGDLNNYLLDTLALVDEFKEIGTPQEYISKSIVLMQVIYIHQDLIDELLYIFKLPTSSKNDKNPNRNIRNELVGHPIRREIGRKKELISSVLFDVFNRSNKELRYTKYSKENAFKPDLLVYDIEDIIKRHQQFLNKYLNKIIEKILKEEKKYKERMGSLKKIPLSKQFDFIEQNDSQLLSEIDYIFEIDNLRYYYRNIKKHPRYKHCIDNFVKTLDEVLFTKNISYSNDSMDIYMKEQLYKKDKFFNIDYWIRKYSNNKQVIEELNHMKKHINNDMEYYASLNYLASIF